jgi:glutamate dehydrogenase (NAD(P)+)
MRLYNPGPDVGTNDQDMKTIAIENGLDVVVSKPAEMGGNRIDQLGAAAGGVVIALETLHQQAERLRSLSQFRDLKVPAWKDVSVIVQGFGAVGAHVARLLWDKGEPKGDGPRVIGISDARGYLYSKPGLDIELLLKLRDKGQIVSKPYFLAHPDALESESAELKFSSARDDLLRESAFALIPAAPQANYLDVDNSTHPSMTVDQMGRWSLIVEGANTYSPDPRRKAARRRMERKVYQERGTLIATDFLVNSGGVIFAAHERLIPTPADVRIPNELLGNRAAVDDWLAGHASQFAALAEQRRLAAEHKRETVIHENMVQLIDGLVADDDALPCQVAERISINRIVRRESRRLASEVMIEMAQVSMRCTVQEAAQVLVEKNTDLLSVVTDNGQVVGIVTDWDITQAAARGQIAGVDINAIMSREVVSCRPDDSILDVVQKLENYSISAVPVLSPDGHLLGAVTADLLATRTLYRLLLGDQQNPV